MTVERVRPWLAVGIEILALYGAAALLVAICTGGDVPGPSLAAVAAASLLAFGLGRLLQETSLDETAVRVAGLAISGVLLAAVIYAEYGRDAWPWQALNQATDPPAIFGVVLAFSGIWLRNVRRGQEPIERDDVVESAGAAVIILGIAAVARPEAAAPESYGVLALIAAVGGLVTLALYRAIEPGESLLSFGRRWSAGLVGIIALAAVISIAVAAVDADSLGFMEPVARPAGEALLWTLGILLAPIVFAVEGIFAAVAWLFGRITPDHRPQPPQEQQPVERPPQQDDNQPAWIRIVGIILGGGLASVLVVAMLLMFWFSFRRFVKRQQRGARERREGIEPASTLADDLSMLWDAMRRPFSRARGSASRVEIRRLYHEILDRAADEGLERGTAVTPTQFAPSLRTHFGSSAPEEITAAFVASRYGEMDVDADAVEQLRRAWRGIP
jgi:hypothetical protein